MRSFLSPFARFSFVLMILGGLALSAHAQLSLRTAMDTNADGKADLTVFRPRDNTWYILRAGSVARQAWGWAGEDMFVPGDYDGDGIGDLAVWRDSDGVWYILNSRDGSITYKLWGLTGDEPVFRDYDGDGRTDFAVIRRSGGIMTWHILRSTEGPISIVWGLDTDTATPGDYDGDGRFDLSVRRPGPTPLSVGTFYTLNSRDGNPSIVQWGYTKDLVVPGDYDGDGRSDYAIFREGSTPESVIEWWILQSRDGIAAYSFGATGTDYNVQNDYDGDGKTDIAIWRDSDGTFWLRSSIDGQISAARWGAPNDYPVASYDTH